MISFDDIDDISNLTHELSKWNTMKNDLDTLIHKIEINLHAVAQKKLQLIGQIQPLIIAINIIIQNVISRLILVVDKANNNQIEAHSIFDENI